MNEIEKLETENIELDLLLEGILLKYGYNFKNYNKSHLKRRVLTLINSENLGSITMLIKNILYDKEEFQKFLLAISINVTEMFRFPQFFKDIRENIIPILKTYPSINIWHAGCSTGEEVISMAILLDEEGLLERTRIYATDINQKVLNIASKGIYPISEIKKWTKNYQEAGGKRSFSEYYTAKYDSVIFNEKLYKNVVFNDHNLVHDKEFINANMVLCRNVLIYFNKTLKEQVLNLFDNSLIAGGILGIGSKETIKFSGIDNKYDTISNKSHLYIKRME